MMIPPWVPILVAVWVIAFGIFRIYIATRKIEKDPEEPNLRRKGFYARSKRTHILFGIAYLLLGAYCLAMGFGYQVDLIGACMQNQEQPAASDSTPVEGGVEVEVGP